MHFRTYESSQKLCIGRHVWLPTKERKGSRESQQMLKVCWVNFKMAADATLRSSCQKSHDNLFFDYIGDNPKWKPVSLTHVEYPKGT